MIFCIVNLCGFFCSLFGMFDVEVCLIQKEFIFQDDSGFKTLAKATQYMIILIHIYSKLCRHFSGQLKNKLLQNLMK